MSNARARGPWVLLATWAVSAIASCDPAAPHAPGSVEGSSPGDGRRPTVPRAVLLIVVDTLRRDHLGCYGYERDTSPNLDRFAAESVRYEQAISQAPWTTPSIGSLLTSRYPSMLGIESERSILDDDVVLLAESLQEAGHVTGAVISHSFCSSDWGFAQGFDSFDESQVGIGLSSPQEPRSTPAGNPATRSSARRSAAPTCVRSSSAT